MSGPDPSLPLSPTEPLTSAARLRLAAAVLGLAAGIAALVIAIELVRITLS